jgi:exoribonuclease-2
VGAYAHSTAPNRRYPDVVTQRLLHAAHRGDPSPYDLDALTRIAARCVEANALARKVERQVAKSAAALFLAGRVGERFDAVVTGVTEGGCFVRLRHPAVEGRLVQGEAGLDVGEHVDVRLDRCDVTQGHLDFSRAPE